MASRRPDERVQRREYARLPVDAPIMLSSSVGTCRATLVDISEAALRARVPAREAACAGLEPGDEVRAAFTLHGTGFMLRGTVLRTQDADEPNTVDVVVMLDIPARTANDLRRTVVFARVEQEHGQDS